MMLLFVLACGQQPPPQNLVAYRLYTHCGVLYADFQGKRYYADPPVSDGNSNPGPGWGNPDDYGTMTVVDANTVVFTDPAGNRARFTTRPASGIPTIYPCD
jgi:hypothetical protein